MNQGGRPQAGSRIHESMQARASCVPDPGREELDRELGRIMAPGPRPGTGDPELARQGPRRRFLAWALACGAVVPAVAGAAVLALHARPAIAAVLFSAAFVEGVMFAASRAAPLLGRCHRAARNELMLMTLRVVLLMFAASRAASLLGRCHGAAGEAKDRGAEAALGGIPDPPGSWPGSSWL